MTLPDTDSFAHILQELNGKEVFVQLATGLEVQGKLAQRSEKSDWIAVLGDRDVPTYIPRSRILFVRPR